MPFSIEIFGHLGGVCVASALAPQIVKAWKTKSTTDISLLWNFLLLAGLTFFLIYGIGISSRPIIIFNSIEILFTFSLLVLKLIYK